MNKAVKKKREQLPNFKLKKNSTKNTTKNIVENSTDINSKKSRFTRILLISLIILACLVFIISVLILFTHPTVLALKEVNATLNITDHIGFNLNPDKIHFGSMFSGGKSVRSINIISDRDGYVYVTVVNDSNDWIYVYDQNFFILKDSSMSLTFAAMPPTYFEEGNYEVALNIYVLKKKPSLFTKLFLEGKMVSLTSQEYMPGSAVISLNITNSSNQ
jgi:hypothetical protein